MCRKWEQNSLEVEFLLWILIRSGFTKASAQQYQFSSVNFLSWCMIIWCVSWCVHNSVVCGVPCLVGKILSKKIISDRKIEFLNPVIFIEKLPNFDSISVRTKTQPKKMMFGCSTKYAAIVLLISSLMLVARVDCGSCRDSSLCCNGRDSSCVVQKAPINSIIEDLNDKPCYCDHACLRLGDCCADFKQYCGGKYSTKFNKTKTKQNKSK